MVGHTNVWDYGYSLFTTALNEAVEKYGKGQR